MKKFLMFLAGLRHRCHADRRPAPLHRANNTKARLTFSAGSYLVEVDAAGNGPYVVVP